MCLDGVDGNSICPTSDTSNIGASDLEASRDSISSPSRFADVYRSVLGTIQFNC